MHAREKKDKKKKTKKKKASSLIKLNQCVQPRILTFLLDSHAHRLCHRHKQSVQNFHLCIHGFISRGCFGHRCDDALGHTENAGNATWQLIVGSCIDGVGFGVVDGCADITANALTYCIHCRQIAGEGRCDCYYCTFLPHLGVHASKGAGKQITRIWKCCVIKSLHDATHTNTHTNVIGSRRCHITTAPNLKPARTALVSIL